MARLYDEASRRGRGASPRSAGVSRQL